MGPLSDHLVSSGQSQLYIHTSKIKQTQLIVLIYLYTYICMRAHTHINVAIVIKKEILNLRGSVDHGRCWVEGKLCNYIWKFKKVSDTTLWKGDGRYISSQCPSQTLIHVTDLDSTLLHVCVFYLCFTTCMDIWTFYEQAWKVLPIYLALNS